MVTVPERHGQMDGRTDDIGLLWHNRAQRSIARKKSPKAGRGRSFIILPPSAEDVVKCQRLCSCTTRGRVTPESCSVSLIIVPESVLEALNRAVY